MIPLEEQEAAATAQAYRMAAQAGVRLKTQKSKRAGQLEEIGWQPWLTSAGPASFTGEFADFHSDFWNWYWPLLRARQAGKPAPHDKLAYLLTLGRGLGKSVTVEWAVIMAGAILGEVVAIYVSSTGALATTHLQSIRQRIESAQVSDLYPSLSEPDVGKHGNRYGWRGDMLSTSQGLTVFGVGLEEEVRGLRVGDLRPGLIVLDDIDSKTDSPAIVAKKEQIIAGSILPTGRPDTIILLAQNLIHDDSVASRIVHRRSEILSHRQESGIVKAFTDDFEIEQQDTRYVIVSGQPRWNYFDIAACQKFLDDSGPVETYAEYQHEFDKRREGLVLKAYRDAAHVIRLSDFKRIYGTAAPPKRWYKYLTHDWARTKSEFHANVSLTLTVAGQADPLPGSIFLFDLKTHPPGALADDVALAMLRTIAPDGPDVNDQVTAWDTIIKRELSRADLEQHFTDATQALEARRSVLAKVLPPLVSQLLIERHFVRFTMSHEQINDAGGVYRRVFGLPATPVNPGASGGLALLNWHMTVDRSRPHLILDDKLGDDGLYERGHTRFFVVVPDEEYERSAATPDKLEDSQLARYQFEKWRYQEMKMSASGAEERGPQKMLDDFGNALQFLWVSGAPAAAPLTETERKAVLLNQKLEETVTKPLPQDADDAALSRIIWADQFEKEQQAAKPQQIPGRAIVSVPRGVRIRFR